MTGKQRANKTVWVAASKVGRAAYCPHALELETKGTKVSGQAKAARERGELKHDEFNRLAEDKRCFIATYLYGSEDPRTELLRQYRDQELRTTRLGRAIIRLYYSISPALITCAEKVPLFRSFISVSVLKFTKFAKGRLND